MAFEIGNVVSPQVAAALIRRGENRGSGGGIKRRDPIKRTSTTNTEDKDQAAFDRLALAQQAQEEQIAMAKRREAFDRERFELGREDKEKDREAAKAIGGAKAEKDAKISQGKIRDKATKIVQEIGKALMAGNKPNPDSGKPDPEAQRIAKQTADALWSQLQSLGLPPEELAQIAETLKRALPTTAAPRAPGGGIDRQAQAQPQAPAIGVDGLPAGPGENHLTGDMVRSAIDSGRENPDPPDEEFFRMLDANGLLHRIPQGAQLHNDGTMTLLTGERVPIQEKYLIPDNRGNFSRGGGGASKVEPGLSRELGTPTRTP